MLFLMLGTTTCSFPCAWMRRGPTCPRRIAARDLALKLFGSPAACRAYAVPCLVRDTTRSSSQCDLAGKVNASGCNVAPPSGEEWLYEIERLPRDPQDGARVRLYSPPGLRRHWRAAGPVVT